MARLLVLLFCFSFRVLFLRPLPCPFLLTFFTRDALQIRPLLCILVRVCFPFRASHLRLVACSAFRSDGFRCFIRHFSRSGLPLIFRIPACTGIQHILVGLYFPNGLLRSLVFRPSRPDLVRSIVRFSSRDGHVHLFVRIRLRSVLFRLLLRLPLGTNLFHVVVRHQFRNDLIRIGVPLSSGTRSRRRDSDGAFALRSHDEFCRRRAFHFPHGSGLGTRGGDSLLPCSLAFATRRTVNALLGTYGANLL
mmetsp:Transcript_91650/g.258768  ORF Transcript_91650/g.258768 Transcript_91650/m.258768 type:complete len:249 (+) Transcript_91650:3345-4091(+)